MRGWLTGCKLAHRTRFFQIHDERIWFMNESFFSVLKIRMLATKSQQIKHEIARGRQMLQRWMDEPEQVGCRAWFSNTSVGLAQDAPTSDGQQIKSTIDYKRTSPTSLTRTDLYQDHIYMLTTVAILYDTISGQWSLADDIARVSIFTKQTAQISII